MAVTMLSPGASVRYSVTSLEIDWQVSGTTVDQVRAGFEPVRQPGLPSRSFRSLGGQRLLLTALSEATSLVVRPAPRRPCFDDGVTVAVQVSLPGSGAGEQAVLRAVDVSGTESAVLLTVTPESEGWTITATATGGPGTSAGAAAPGGPDGQARDPLPGRQKVASAPVLRAVYSARRQIGAQAPPAELLRRYLLVLDSSASMLPHHRSGALQSLLEVVLGVDLVCGTVGAIPVWATGRPPQLLAPALSTETVADYVATVVEQRPLASGTAFAPLVAALAAGEDPETVVVISDGVPADAEAFAEALAAEALAAAVGKGGAGRRRRWHLLLLARSGADPAVVQEPWRDELCWLAPYVEGGLVSVGAVMPGTREGWLAEALAAQDRMDALTAGLVAGKTPKPSGTPVGDVRC